MCLYFQAIKGISAKNFKLRFSYFITMMTALILGSCAYSLCAHLPERTFVITNQLKELSSRWMPEENSFVIFGFSYQESQTEISTDLEGIITKTPEGMSALTRYFYKKYSMFELASCDSLRIYAAEVEPGEFNLNGFVLSLSPQFLQATFVSYNPAFKIPPKKAVYIGSFYLGPKDNLQEDIRTEDGRWTKWIIKGYAGVSIRLDLDVYQWLEKQIKIINGREVISASPSPLKVQNEKH